MHTRTIAGMMAELTGDVKNARIDATPGGLEAQIAEGQARLCREEILPRDMNGWQPALEAMGISFGECVDDFFIQATLPPGWSKKATQNPEVTDLLDDKGRKRACIYYKGVFYHPRASIAPVRRFSVLQDFDRKDEGLAVVTVKDGDTVIFTAGPVELPGVDDHVRRWEITTAVKKTARDWLAERYPDWEKPTAYWD